MSVFFRASLALIVAAVPAFALAQQGQSSSDGYYKGSRYGRASNQMRRAAEPAQRPAPAAEPAPASGPAPEPQSATVAEPENEMKSATDAALSQILGTAPPPQQQPQPADEDRLKILSEQVVQSIAGFGGEEDKAAELRGQLQGLVSEARASGRDDVYIGALIDEASEGRLAEIPAALKTSDNRLDTATLLQGIVGEAADAPRDGYVEALQEETGEGAGEGAEVAAEAQTAPRLASFDVVAVQPGDTLSVISARVYGDGLLFGRIFEANRDILSSPDRVRVGQRLRIPR